MKRYWYSTFLAASLAAVIAVEYVPGAVRKLTPWYEAGAMERETDEGAAKKPDIGAREKHGRKRSQKRRMERERLPSPAGQAVRPGRRLPVGRRYLRQRKRLWLQSPLELRPCP